MLMNQVKFFFLAFRVAKSQIMSLKLNSRKILLSIDITKYVRRIMYVTAEIGGAL